MIELLFLFCLHYIIVKIVSYENFIFPGPIKKNQTRKNAVMLPFRSIISKVWFNNF